MEQRTRDHLRAANVHRNLARELLSANLKTSPYDWVVVIAFYAAVHYVNAYLWEKDNRYQPTNHADRRRKVNTLAALQPAAPSYRRLQSLGYDLRYDPTRHVNRATAESALRDLWRVESTVRAAL